MTVAAEKATAERVRLRSELSQANTAAGAADAGAAASPEREVYALQAAEQALATVHARAASLAAQVDAKDAAIERLKMDKAFAVRLLAEERRRTAIAEHSSGSGSAVDAAVGGEGEEEESGDKRGPELFK